MTRLEIDEILTLRVMTLTDEEKDRARATDPRAAQLIDRCDTMSPEALLTSARGDADPFWDSAVDPGIDVVLVDGVPGRSRQPCPVAAVAARRRPGHLFRPAGSRGSTSVHRDGGR